VMNAYDKLYLEKARTSLACMLDCGVNHLGYELRDFWNIFLVSDISRKFAHGDATTIAGKSGVELSLILTNTEYERANDYISINRSPEYWAGWALAYYQWESGLSFSQIDKLVSIENIVALYHPYHEMDISKFCDRINRVANEQQTETNLKRIRLSRNLTQRELAEQTGIPIRTIQQYEQRQKDINGARAEYVVLLSRALYCNVSDLLENIIENNNILTINEIKLLIVPIIKKYKIKRVSLFGSYARSEATANSDVDFLVEGGSFTGLLEYTHFTNSLEDALGKKVDVILHSTLSSSTKKADIKLLKNIEKDKVEIYAG